MLECDRQEIVMDWSSDDIAMMTNAPIFLQEIDIFSLGIIFYYVFSKGSHPYSDDMANVNEKVRDNDPNLSGLSNKSE